MGHGDEMTAPDQSVKREGRAHRIVEWVVSWIQPEVNPQAVIYGIVIVGSVVAAESVQPSSGWRDVIATTVVLLVYWLVHTYAAIMGERFGAPEPISFKAVRATMAHEWGIMRGASLPILAMAMTALLDWSALRVAEVGMVAAVVSLTLVTILGGIRAGMRLPSIILQGLVGAMFGVFIALIRAVLA